MTEQTLSDKIINNFPYMDYVCIDDIREAIKKIKDAIRDKYGEDIAYNEAINEIMGEKLI